MRVFLVASQQMLQATLQDNMLSVENTARKVGIKLLKAASPSIRKKLPTHFTELGPKVHMGLKPLQMKLQDLEITQ